MDGKYYCKTSSFINYLQITIMKIIHYLLILTFFSVTSCIREPFDDKKNCSCDLQTVKLQLAFSFAHSPHGIARNAIGEAQENSITTLDLLAFKVDNGVEKFQYWVEAEEAVDNVGGASSQEFYANLRIEDYQQRFVLISNARSKIQTLIDRHNDGYVDIEKEAMLKNLTFDLNNGDRWSAINAADYTAIPMWGESEPTTIGETTTTISSSPIRMLRMVARIDVQLDVVNNPEISSTFQLKSVYMCNINTSGRIVPKPGTEYFDATNMIALKASLPESVETILGPLAYTDDIVDHALKGAIYLFETAANNMELLKETCIIIGGIYESDANISFYRIYFYGTDRTTHIDILRNHRYVCNITKVYGRGFPTVEEAFESKDFLLETDIIDWDEGMRAEFIDGWKYIGDVHFNQQYMLTVSRDDFILPAEASTDNCLTIITDCPSWDVAVSASKGIKYDPLPGDWLRITPPISGTGDAQPYDILFAVDDNTGSADRTAYIHVYAGSGQANLSYVVPVVQKTLPYSITYLPNNGSGTPLTVYADSNGDITIANIGDTGFTNPGMGFSFAGWYTNADGTGTRYYPGTTTTLTQSITLYARWVIVT